MRKKKVEAMATKDSLLEWVHDAVVQCGGRARLIDVARCIWSNHEAELRLSGDLFYTWQYDMRWAATKLRTMGIMKPNFKRKGGRWELGAGKLSSTAALPLRYASDDSERGEKNS